MYTEYWGLHKAPFDNVPDPSMYVDCHSSMENTIAETLFAIEEGNECLAVIIGDVGLGKTMSLRMIIDSLDEKKYRIALITNPGISFIQLLREIIGQLSGKQCDEKRKLDLLEAFNRLLFEAVDAGKKILILIDEANAITPANLESLRLLTNMQDDRKNLFTLVLAGQMELARRLEHPKRANLYQRIGTYCRIDKIPSPESLRTYAETRLRLAGCAKTIFPDDAYPVLWEYSEEGVPRLVNKICKLCLKAGETNGFDRITAEVVRQVGERFRKISAPAIQARKPRKILEPAKVLADTPAAAPAGAAGDAAPTAFDEQPAVPERESQAGENRPPADPVAERAALPENAEEVEVAGWKIRIHLPQEDRIQDSDDDQCLKLAGALAAKTMRDYPEIASSPLVDAFSLWNEIRNVILNRIERKSRTPSAL